MGKFADRGLTYTYTERRDVLGYECFVGVIINDGELFIKEAGEHCQRDVEPLRLGMKVTRQGRNFLFIQNLKRISDNSREEAEHLLPTITKRLLPVFLQPLVTHHGRLQSPTQSLLPRQPFQTPTFIHLLSIRMASTGRRRLYHRTTAISRPRLERGIPLLKIYQWNLPVIEVCCQLRC